MSVQHSALLQDHTLTNHHIYMRVYNTAMPHHMLSASRLISTRALPHAFALGTHPWHRMSSTLPPSHPNVVASAKARGGTSGVVEEGDLPEGRIVETELRHEAERSYMAYAMSVIVGRALPDVRDGLKPVQRRILYAMEQLGLDPNKPYRKCARVVGEVLGKYHPHGDASVYDALVRMAQDFSMRAPLVAGHGNFGSLDDDPPAAMRYTECRLQPLSAAALLADLDSNTVDFAPNFDASQEEPVVLPARVPLLLVNGTGGIAVGIATKIPPHNLVEVVGALEALVGDPGMSVKELMRFVPAPDFPTGAEILVNEGVQDAYTHGRGSITVRAKSHIELNADNGRRKGSGKDLVVITELPFQVYKADIVESVAKLVEDGTITGVSDVRDESDRTGVRVVVEVKKGSNAQLVQNALFKHTSLQTRFSCNMVALVHGTPLTLTLKDFLQHFLDFRCQVIIRRAQHDLQRAQARLHHVEGLLVVFGNLDAVLSAIRKAASTADAAAVLQERFGLSKEQTSGVLGMSLGRLTSLEEEKLRGEAVDLEGRIKDLVDLVGNKKRVLSVVVHEAKEIATKYGTPRRSTLVQGDTGEITATDVIPNDPCVIMFSRKGYIKRMPADVFGLQNRGTKGKQGGKMREDDVLDAMLSAHAHDPVLVFTQDGVVRSLPAYQIPEASRASGGTALAQVLPGTRSAMIAAMMVLPDAQEDGFLLMLTEKGFIKKTALSQFVNHNRSRGLSAIKLRAGDKLLAVAQCCSNSQVIVCASCGTGIRFTATQEQLREMSRMHGGVAAMKLNPGSRIVGMGVITEAIMDGAGPSIDPMDEDDDKDDNAGDLRGPWLLVASTQGKGKRVPLSAIRPQRRGGKGVCVMKLRDGDELAALAVVEDESSKEIIVGTKNGVVNRTGMDSAPVLRSRATQGVRMVRLNKGDEVQAVALAPPDEQRSS